MIATRMANLSWAAVKEVIILVLVLVLALGMIAVAEGSRPLMGSGAVRISNLKTLSMEVEDLPLLDQRKVMELGKKFETATRHLIAKDPYSTNY